MLTFIYVYDIIYYILYCFIIDYLKLKIKIGFKIEIENEN